MGPVNFGKRLVIEVPMYTLPGAAGLLQGMYFVIKNFVTNYIKSIFGKKLKRSSSIHYCVTGSIRLSVMYHCDRYLLVLAKVD